MQMCTQHEEHIKPLPGPLFDRRVAFLFFFLLPNELMVSNAEMRQLDGKEEGKGFLGLSE